MHGFFLMGDIINIYKRQDSQFAYLWVGVFGGGCGVFVSVVFKKNGKL
jgi:Mg2+ and Co2+ transporter CorA